MLLTSRVQDHTPGLTHQQVSGGHVPGVDVELKVRIHSTQSDVSHVECSRAPGPYPGTTTLVITKPHHQSASRAKVLRGGGEWLS